MTDLLPKDRRILEKGLMEFRPFGTDLDGTKIRDVSGTTVRANVEYLEECVGRTRGAEAGAQAVERLVALLNERIPDPAYHVTPAFLKNVWNSYSYEFLMFLKEFCRDLSGDPHFQFHVGKRFISPLIQTLGRPFSVPQIYRMFAYFGDKFVKGSIEYGIGTVTEQSAILRVKFTDRVYRQFGPYRKACAALSCEAMKSALASVPWHIHRLPDATVTDLSCIANGDEYCEWELRWSPSPRRQILWPAAALSAGVAIAPLVVSTVRHPSLSTAEASAIVLLPALAAATAVWSAMRRKARARDGLIQEQMAAVETRHEELRESYLDQEQTTVELRKKVIQLTTLHRAGLLFGSTLDRDTLIRNVLETMVRDLHYDRAMISFYDRDRGVSHGARMLGVAEEVANLAHSQEIPVTDPDSLEGTVLLKGQPVLVADLAAVRHRLHPLNRQLAEIAGARCLLAVPLKVTDRVLGSLTVDRTAAHSLTQDDLSLMVTFGNQVAIALASVEAYRQIEELNVGLEAKVRERTTELQRVNQELKAANERLRELDQLKSAFVSIVSHELRTPLTSIKGYVENILDGLAGELSDRQSYYLKRVHLNVERLTRMVNDLLDLSRIEDTEKRHEVLRPGRLCVQDLILEVVESFQTIARERSVTVTIGDSLPLPPVRGDRDKLHQVLTNLIGNAVKFTPPGGAVRVETSAPSDGTVQVCIADTGCGIPPDEQDKVFDKFFRGSAIPDEARGAGLGLAITKSLVELHGGRIWLESTPGHGSRFFFSLPTDRPAPPASR
jgi:signal transduction histidine kinase